MKKKNIFRNMFIEERDLDIATVLFNYFSAVQSKWPDGWNARSRGLILNRTNGFRALMRVLRPVYLTLAKPGQVVSFEAFEREFEQVDVDSAHFNTDNYQAGTSGESALRNDLLNWLGFDGSGKPLSAQAN
jgi:hypothetical protein